MIQVAVSERSTRVFGPIAATRPRLARGRVAAVPHSRRVDGLREVSPFARTNEPITTAQSFPCRVRQKLLKPSA